jgi:hypothetical protein
VCGGEALTDDSRGSGAGSSSGIRWAMATSFGHSFALTAFRAKKKPL